MKTFLTLIFLAMPASVIAGPQLLGPLVHTIPPLPEPPPDLPEIPQSEIVKTETHDLCDRKAVIQEMTAESFPALPKPPIPKTQPSRPPMAPENVRARLTEMRSRQLERQRRMPLISAVVYRSQAFSGQVRTLFALKKLPFESTTAQEVPYVHSEEFVQENQPIQDGGHTVYFWSTIDANLLSQLPHWQATDGTVYEGLQLTLSNVDLDQRTAFYASRGRVYPAPEIPALSPSTGNYQIVSGETIPEEAAAIRALHDLYGAEHGKLLAAYQARELALKERAEYLKANPPKPKDLVIRYRMLSSEESK